MKKIIVLMCVTFLSSVSLRADVYGGSVFGAMDYTNYRELCPIKCSQFGMDWKGTTHPNDNGQPICDCE